MSELAIYSAIGGAVGGGFIAGAKVAFDFFKTKHNNNNRHNGGNDVCVLHDSMCEKLTEIAIAIHQTSKEVPKINENIIAITTEFKLFKEEVRMYYAQKNKGGDW